MTTMDMSERLARLDHAIESNAVARGRWQGCLLAQLSPEAERAESATACPSEVMPAWLAILTPRIDDEGTIERWPEFVRRYAAVAHRWHALTPEQWTRLDYRCRAIAVREAMRHTEDAIAIAACNGMLALLDRAGAGDMSRAEEGSAEAWAAAAAEAEAWAAAEAEARAAAAWDRMIDAWLTEIDKECGS